MSPDLEAAQLLARYREPGGAIQFVRGQLHAEPDTWQAEALVSYQKNPRTALKACKGPGKTTVLSWIGWHFLSCYVNANIAATSISGANLKDGLWKEMAIWQQKSPFLEAAFTWTAERIVSKERPGSWWMSARTWPKSADTTQQSNTLAGLHSDHMLFLLDETGAMPSAIMATAEAALASGKVTRIVQAGNPTNLTGPLYEACTIHRGLWNVIEVTGDPDDPRRSARVKLEWAKEQIQKYGKDSPWVQINVFGNFPKQSLNTLLGPDEVAEAQRRHLRKESYDWAQKRLGIDVARFGDDLTVIFPRQGLASFPPKAMNHERDSAVSVDIASRVMLAKQRWGSEVEIFDATGGWAAGARDIMVAAGHSPLNVQYHAPAMDQRYKNRRAENWWHMAQWVKNGGALPPVDDLVAELTVPTYSFVGGQFLVEPKELIKERLQRSPNYADALSNTFALPDMPGAMQKQLQRKSQSRDADFDPFRNMDSSSPSADFDPFRGEI